MSVNKVNSDGSLSRIAGGTLYADLPIGSWVKNDSNEVPSGFLKAGDAIDPTLYPELYAIYESSTVPYKADTSQLSDYEDINLSSQVTMQYDGFLSVIALDHQRNIIVNNVRVSSASPVAEIDGSGFIAFRKGDVVKLSNYYNGCAKVAYYKKSLIVKAKHTPVPTDFTDSLIGYLGQETNYNLYPWSHVRTMDGADTSENITIERDGWYSIDYTLSSSTDASNSFTFRDTDSQGNVHTIMRSVYDKSGDFRQTFLVPLKAGNYIYSHGGVGTLSVYMNRRDFA